MKLLQGLAIFSSVLSDNEHGYIPGKPKIKNNQFRKDINPAENTEKYWRDLTKNEIKKAIEKERIEKKAKNVILFIGDGMGYPSQSAGRILKGGEEYYTTIDKLPFSGLLFLIYRNIYFKF